MFLPHLRPVLVLRGDDRGRSRRLREVFFSDERSSGGTPEMKPESKKDVIGVASHALFSAELRYDSEPKKTQ